MDAAVISSQCPEVDAQAIARHVSRLDEEYLRTFDQSAISRHVKHLAALSRENPARIEIERDEAGQISVTVFAFDHPFEFSIITGTLAASGFGIESGDVFTLRASRKEQKPQTDAQAVNRFVRDRRVKRHRLKSIAPRDALRNRVIIDRFTGTLLDPVSFDEWADKLRERLIKVLTLLDDGNEQTTEDARRRVVEWVTRRIHSLKKSGRRFTVPTRIEFGRTGRGTKLNVTSQDTPAFLYALSTALSLHHLTIEDVLVRSRGDEVEDEVIVVDRHGKAIEDESTLNHVRLSVLLTKQFTYFLDTAPDPYKALTRFEQLAVSITEQDDMPAWFELLEDPRTMETLAKLLGSSDWLWEDFIRAKYGALLRLLQYHQGGKRFCQSSESLAMRMERCIEDAVGLAEQCDRLNKFKDEEIFLIDLDHILTPHADFRELSRHLTLLAENLVALASRLVYEDLVRSYGRPVNADDKASRHAVFALGKLGGVALGYASDIELLFLYDGKGKTQGGKRRHIDNSEFFIQHAQETSQFIRAKHKGIFEVDLRLRPFGKESPVACTLDQFVSYYKPGGAAHSFEKLALGRLRWIAGEATLGYEVEKLRNHYLFDLDALDMNELRDIWDKQRIQKNEPGKLNAKYSPGALTDLEGAIQLLQVRHASRAPQLRTPRLSSAMEGLRRAGVLDPVEFNDIVSAYYFFRQLINALRMLRGNAQDLFLPPEDSAELTHLARRMDYDGDGDREPARQLLDEFTSRTRHVRDFIKKHFEHDVAQST